MLVLNGKIKTVYVSDRNPDSPDHINNQPLAVREAVEAMCKEIGHGLTLKNLTDDDSSGSLRMCFNIYSLDKWRKSFIYQGNMNFKEDLW